MCSENVSAVIQTFKENIFGVFVCSFLSTKNVLKF